jgi:hypothetical protein
MPLRRPRPEVATAVVNAAVTLLLPAVVVGAASLAQRYDRHNYSATVHASDWSPLLAAVRMLLSSAFFASPTALLAGWLTWAHARRWPDDQE